MSLVYKHYQQHYILYSGYQLFITLLALSDTILLCTSLHSLLLHSIYTFTCCLKLSTQLGLSHFAYTPLLCLHFSTSLILLHFNCTSPHLHLSCAFFHLVHTSALFFLQVMQLCILHIFYFSAYEIRPKNRNEIVYKLKLISSVLSSFSQSLHFILSPYSTYSALYWYFLLLKRY